MLTDLSMITGSEGVSFLFPQDFFSQHRLEIEDVQCSNMHLLILKAGFMVDGRMCIYLSFQRDVRSKFYDGAR